MGNPHIDDVATAHDKVLRVYQETWNDFYKWEQESCLQDILSLLRSKPEDASNTEVETDLSELEIPSDSFLSDNESTTVEEVIHYIQSGELSDTTTATCKVVTAPSIEAYPVYESCTPVPGNLLRHHPLEYNDDTITFFPVDSNGVLNSEEFLDECANLAWMVDQRDPDRELFPSHSCRDPDKLIATFLSSGDTV